MSPRRHRTAGSRGGPRARSPHSLLALALLTLVGLPVAPPLLAQSLLSGAGIGVPVDPLDARSRALGGVGVALSGWHLAPMDPAAAAGIFLPSVTVTFQPGSVTPAEGVRTGQARFPVLGASYPLWGNVFSLQVGSGLDQRWELRTEDTIHLGEVEVDVIDVYRSSGSLGRVQVGWSRRVRESLAVGASAGSQVGSIQRSFTRGLDPETAGSGVETFVTQGRWRASGLILGAGVTWDPYTLLRLSGAASWSGELRLAPVGGQAVATRSYSMPLDLRVGSTLTLAAGLELTGSLSWADWSGVADEMGEADVRDSVLHYGAGLEWTRGELLGRTFPIRFGIRSQDLPFHYRGSPATERAYSVGFGMNLAQVQDLPTARFDFGLERGDREAGEYSEQFLRATVTLRLAGG